ncbi:MAG TPA: DUF5916 domain-containing protein [Chitinophagaceae bacterium]|nr:DUF5916 domain-containing protein [Chitinophagaceae bacterium]
MKGLCLVVLCCILTFPLFAQTNTISAVKTTQAIRIDGNLDDAAWQDAPSVSNFTQYFPTYGIPGTTKTTVKILYDNSAVYISAYLYDDAAQIRKQLTARDGEQRTDADYFSVFFDTYNDQQNGFQFLVTSANVQTDAKLGGSSSFDFGDYGDKSWDAVWQSKTAMKTDGWVVEMRIPYISLRFAKKEIQNWGLQFLRFTRRNNESSFWNPVTPNISGFVNQFGKYQNLQNIEPPLRLSFSPYLLGGVRFVPEGSGHKTEWLRSGGMDVKYGINESFTLDATLIPDFGQVVSDNVINNLTPYEQRFSENRPFFTEGTELFNKAGLFYSRRIGATPSGYNNVYNLVENNPDLRIIKNPPVTRLYNALKLSGRTKRKLGIGVFNAIAQPMSAELNNTRTGRDTMLQTEPLANYNIIVLDQAFKGRSFVTFTNTNVIRRGNNRDANVTSLDFAAFDKTGVYSIKGTTRYSKVWGLTPYPYNIFIAPFVDTISNNGTKYLTAYDGYAATVEGGKVSGKVQYFASVNVESNTYDPTDLGYLQVPNNVKYNAGISYNQFTPTKHFLNYNYNVNFRYNWLYKPYSFNYLEVTANAFWIFKNFWDININTGVRPYWQNDFFELQTPGLFVKKPWYFFTFLNGSTDSRKRLFASYEFGFAEGALQNNAFFEVSGGLRYRFSNKFSLSLNTDRQHDKMQIGYAFLREANGAPILGFRDVKDLTTILSGTYNFTSRMNLTLRARHYWNKVHYLSFHNVKSDGFYSDRAFVPDQDQNFNVFNLDAFYTWDFRPGSRIIVGWKNWLGNDYLFQLYGNKFNYYTNNLTNTFSLPHGNEVTLRFIYFLDYNQFRKKN